ncbi:MAG: STAS domain-containing protein [Sulfuriflexus sp.]|nr:STAS domain-containing protein [Sulfuriflexus sp.]
MTIEMKLTEDNKLLVIGVKGAFDFSMLNDFRAAYSADVGEDIGVVIDMRETSSINSSALGMLLNMQRHFGKDDGEIRIINCNDIVRNIFNITHFNKKFNIS